MQRPPRDRFVDGVAPVSMAIKTQKPRYYYAMRHFWMDFLAPKKGANAGRQRVPKSTFRVTMYLQCSTIIVVPRTLHITVYSNRGQDRINASLIN